MISHWTCGGGGYVKFDLVINLERMDPSVDMRVVIDHVTDMVRMADQGGFAIAWAAEHHGIEMTIAPGPFQLLTHWAAHTSRIRLGTAVVVAPYWHPIKLAGEAALFDLLSGGRLEFGIGRGAYQREFDRLMGGMDQRLGVPMMLEMLPALKELWKGDYAHEGRYWSFPASTSCPKPLQKPHPPIWVAARDPGTFNASVKAGHNIMTWPLTRPFSELEEYMRRFEDALAAAGGQIERPKFMTMRHTGIYTKPGGETPFIAAMQRQGRQFENLFRTLGPVINGFPTDPDPALFTNQAEYTAESLMENVILGTPDQAIRKLRRYEALGVDHFCFNSAYGLPHKHQKESLKLFIDEVMPAFSAAAADEVVLNSA
jgi:alkanesulfonate monooxygenase SsuD/methylene tetrahydromethanopterin reductase-like flavin-dependent oxidoreductase (luciferase family)